jgi:Bacterial PH domain/Protein of unknown function (DUF1648)
LAAPRRSDGTNQVAVETQATTSWRSRASRAGILGIVAIALLGLAALASVVFAIRQPVGFGMFVALLVGLICGSLAILVLVLTYGYYALRYRLGRQALIIRWLGREEVVPFAAVDGIFAGPRLGQAMRVRGLNWPGYHIGVGRSRSMGLVRYYTTTGDLNDVALIVTASATYAISPADAEGFRRDLIRRVQLSDEHPDLEDDPPALQILPPTLRDLTLPVALAAALAIVLVSVVYIWARWEALPEVIPIHFAADGTPDGFGPKDDVYKILGIGVAVLIANTGLGLAIYARERALARMLWTTGVVVQFLVLVGIARILH